jgi:hypothetical protein
VEWFVWHWWEGPGRRRIGHSRMRSLSTRLHSPPKFWLEMGRGALVCGAQSVWDTPLGCLISPCGHMQTSSVHLHRPTKDALSPRGYAIPSTLVPLQLVQILRLNINVFIVLGSSFTCGDSSRFKIGELRYLLDQVLKNIFKHVKN